MRQIKIFALLFCSLAAIAWGQTRQWIALFGSENCDECSDIKKFWHEQPSPAENPVLIFINIDNSANYLFLQTLEERLAISKPGMSFPIILLGRTFLSGKDAFLARLAELDDLLADSLVIPECAPLAAAAAAAAGSVCEWDASGQSETSAGTAIVSDTDQGQLLYFFAKGCAKCSRQLLELQILVRSMPDLRLICYDVGTEAGQIMLARAKKHFALPDSTASLTPMVVWNAGYVTARLATAKEIRDQLQPTAEMPFWTSPITKAEKQQFKQQQNMFLGNTTVALIAGAGIVDGLNPCAFATSIFLIGYLLYLKRRPRQIALIGGSFCLGVFGTYLLFGLGLSVVIDFLGNIPKLKIGLYISFSLVGLLLAVLHFRDAVNFRSSGRAKDMEMGLSAGTHRRIHERIKQLLQVNSWLVLPAAVILGTVVSSLELACTGQVYLPVLAAINSTGLNFQAVRLLVLYNVFFILPLLAVTLLAAGGVGAKPLASWAKKHVFATKICMGCLFVVLACVLLLLAKQEFIAVELFELGGFNCLAEH